MKVNDLRIGNLVEYNGTICEVYMLGNEEFLSVYEIDSGKEHYCICYSEINPIPLTSEWLVKFGFEYEAKNRFILNNFVVKYDVLSNRFEFIYNKYVINNIKSIYIHNLQNAYYMNVGYNTGEELTLKNE